MMAATNEKSNVMPEIFRAIFSPKTIGIVLKPIIVSLFISRISKGIAIAKIKANRSAESKTTRE